ncbi:MAG TPA: Rieske 2Fe-2S domain-containing protein [Gemmatimonadaceae bacterium]|nr:Rieske 2Fe-2S domain-containing protein [Gemmatimonadaceae bacterium]
MTFQPDSCAPCPLADASRRAFLRDLGAAAAAVVATLGLPAVASASGWPVVQALARAGDERTYPIPAADGVQIDAKEEVIIARAGNRVFAFSLACPHQNTALRWQPAQSRFACPKHKSTYRPDGTFIAGKATRGMDRFALRRAGANVVVDLSRVHQQDEDPAGWEAAVVTL